MDECYTVLDIINGLKPEYLEIKEKLDELKKYLDIYAKQLDIDFYVDALEHDVPRLFYNVFYNEMIGKFKNGESLNGRAILRESSKPVKRVGRIYVISDAHVFVKNDIEFSMEVDKILNSEFVKNINFKKAFGDFLLNINGYSISFGNSDEFFTCHAYNDDFEILPSQQDLLSYEISKSALPDYYIKKIEDVKCSSRHR